MSRLRIGLAALCALVLLSCLLPILPVQFAFLLLFGWIYFLGRVLPELTIGWSGFATSVVCLVLLAIGTQRLGSWLYAQTRLKNSPPEGRWRWQWTGTVLALVVLTFIAGVSTIGVAHQLGWLLTSKEPWIGGWARAAQRAQSTNNLKQIGLGLWNYHESFGIFPPGGTFDAFGQPLHGWQTAILPFYECSPLYAGINFQIPWDDASNATSFRTRVSVYLNPAYPTPEATPQSDYAISHYAGNSRVLGSQGLAAIEDGLAQTIMAGEIAHGFMPWGYPANWRDPARGINRSSDGFGGPYPGGANVLFADGSVRFLKNTIDPRVLKALSTPAGGESLSADAY